MIARVQYPAANPIMSNPGNMSSKDMQTSLLCRRHELGPRRAVVWGELDGGRDAGLGEAQGH
jgi:hypothetical protein